MFLLEGFPTVLICSHALLSVLSFVLYFSSSPICPSFPCFSPSSFPSSASSSACFVSLIWSWPIFFTDSSIFPPSRFAVSFNQKKVVITALTRHDEKILRSSLIPLYVIFYFCKILTTKSACLCLSCKIRLRASLLSFRA